MGADGGAPGQLADDAGRVRVHNAALCALIRLYEVTRCRMLYLEVKRSFDWTPMPAAFGANQPETAAEEGTATVVAMLRAIEAWGNGVEASLLLDVARRCGLMRRPGVYDMGVRALVSGGSVKQGLTLLQEMTKEGLVPATSTYDLLSEGLLKAGYIDSAMKVMLMAGGGGK